MKRVHFTDIMLIIALLAGITGCQMFEHSPTGVAAPAAGVQPGANFLMGTPELDDWGAYYVQDDTFLRIDIPVAGAIKVEYNVTRGWTGAVFLQTDAPVGFEIGLVTIDGETDVVENVCVSYVEDGSFSATPSNVEETTNGDWTQYLYVNDDGSTRDWWPTSADFTFSGDTTTTCGVVDSEVQWEEITAGAFDKNTDTETAAVAVTYTCDGATYGYKMLIADYLGSGLDILGPGLAGPYSLGFGGASAAVIYNVSGASVEYCIEWAAAGFQRGPLTVTDGSWAIFASGWTIYW